MALLLLAGCGDEDEAETRTEAPDRPARSEHPQEKLKSVEITLDGYPNPENVAVWLAQERGYFEDVGLSVYIHTPITPLMPVKYVNDRAVDLSITHQPQVVLAKEKGVPITTIRSVVPRPTAAMIWLEKSKIGSLSELKGKTIGIPGVPFQEGMLQSVLARAGLTPADVKVEQVEHLLVPALVSGRADAIFGGSWNVEGVELESRGLEPVVTKVEDLGVPAYEELVMIARRDRLAKDPESIRDFIAAMTRGTAAAIEDPEAAADVLFKQGLQPNRKAIEAGVEATLPLLSKTGRMNPARAKRLVDWMREEGLTQQRSPLQSSP